MAMSPGQARGCSNLPRAAEGRSTAATAASERTCALLLLLMAEAGEPTAYKKKTPKRDRGKRTKITVALAALEAGEWSEQHELGKRRLNLSRTLPVEPVLLWSSR